MSSAGQIIGGIAGGVIGFFVGGPVGAFQGAALGAGIGGYIDPPPGPNIRGPELNDKSFQSSAYGVDLPVLAGTIGLMGNVIYLENNEYKAVSKKESQGGKGGTGGGSVETTTYFATFAVSLGRPVPGARPIRIWAGGKLMYNIGSDDFDTLMQSSNFTNWKFYDGTQTEPDSRMESALGVGNCPSYEGTCYIVFYDFDLTDFGNGLAGCQIKVEVDTGNVGQIEGRFLRTFTTPAFPYSQGASSIFVNGGSAFYIPSSVRKSIREEGMSHLGVVTSNAVTAGITTIPFDPDDEIDSGFSIEAIGGLVSNGRGWREFYKDDELGDKYLIAEGFSTGVEVEIGEATTVPPALSVGVAQVVDTGFGAVFSVYRGFGVDRIYGILSADTFYEVSRSGHPAIGFDEVGRLILISPDDGSVGTISRQIIIFNSADTADGIYAAFNSVIPFTNFENTVVADNGLIFILGVPDNDGVDFIVINYQGDNLASGTVDFVGVDLGSTSSRLKDNLWSYHKGTFAFARKSQTTAPSNKTVFVFFTIAPPIGGTSVPLPDLVEQLISPALGDGAVDLTELEGDYVDGYRSNGRSSARGSIAPLQAAYLFDLIEDGYTIRAVKRGSVGSEIIHYEHLIPLSGDGGDLINIDIEQETQLPSKYSINYIDRNREYDTNVQSAEYPSSHENIKNVDIAIVMSEDFAAQRADILINLSHVEKETLSFKVPQIYLHLKASDEKILEVKPGVFRKIRINSVDRAVDQTISVAAKAAEHSVYSSTATGAPATPPNQNIDFIGPSTAVLMDIPLILDNYNVAGYPAAMYGTGTWPGGVLFSSIDLGQTYTAKQSFFGSATIANCLNSLGASDGFTIDRTSVLRISEISGSFESITEDTMMTGRNYCAYGQDGRWEIICYAGAILQTDGSVNLSTFVRGMRGTEWATGLHQDGDLIVALEDPDNVFITENISVVGIERLMRAVTVGKNVTEAETFPFTYNAVNLKPLSPVNIAGIFVGGVGCTISWISRTRFNSSFWVTGNQPPNEPALNFEVDILDGTDVVRTISASTASAVYTEAMMTEDFGSVQTTINIIVYQISATVGRGYPRAATL